MRVYFDRHELQYLSWCVHACLSQELLVKSVKADVGWDQLRLLRDKLQKLYKEEKTNG